MIHVGADLFIRECLNPSDWKHEYTVLDCKGNPKTGYSSNPWNLAGPLCFSGDILAKNVILPEIEEGDYIVIHDSGGYTFSMWSRYNSRFAPRILGYQGDAFEILKEREGMDELIRFWG
jgi:diaminopimelate decarboxylase